MSYSISMDLQKKQSLKQAQRLILSQRMQQALQLLQLPVLEIEQVIDMEMEQNPVMEYAQEESSEEPLEKEEVIDREVSFDDKEFEVLKHLDDLYQGEWSEGDFRSKSRKEQEFQQAYLESTIPSHQTLFEALMEQAGHTFYEKNELQIAELIIGHLNEKGFLEGDLKEIAELFHYDEEVAKEVLKKIQAFDPPGIGARNLREALLLQLERKDLCDSLAYLIVENQFENFLHHRFPLIQKELRVTAKDIEAASLELSKLSLHPASPFFQTQNQAIEPDLFIWTELEGLRVEINNRHVPEIHLNHKYLRLLEDESVSLETKQYVRKKLMSAKWLFQNLSQRNTTLEKIADYLVKYQKEYFSNPSGQLRPLTMKMVAEEVGLHESTIARAVSRKYLFCLRGTLPLRHFFTNAYTTEQGKDISAKTVRELLSELIEQEDKLAPLSDEALSEALKAKGIPCARRTVAKYRSALKIGNALQRKKY